MSDLEFDPCHGPIVGEVTETEATVWYRDEFGLEQAPLFTYWPKQTAKEDDGTNKKITVSLRVDPYADFTSKTRLTQLIPNTQYHYTIISNQQRSCSTGSFRTSGSKSCSFLFGSCIGGQGFGRNITDEKESEGFPIFRAMHACRADFIQIQGDFIYADNAIHAEGTMPWNKGKRFVTPGNVAELPVAIDIDSFRARYKYNLEDDALSTFLRNTVVFNTWDDHEIFDDFGHDRLENQGKEDLYNFGEKVFHEYWPLQGPAEEPKRIYRSMTWGPHVELFILDTRSYRSVHEDHDDDPNTTPIMKHILGQEQKQWLLDGLSKSKSTWKFIATSVPISYPTGWPRPEVTGYDGWSDGNYDTLSGPEEELQEILQHIRDGPIQNVIFISGDVHFPFCIAYRPQFNDQDKPPSEDEDPLVYEFGATPFHALCLPVPERGPDKSFNPQVLYAKGGFAEQTYCNFGHINVRGDSGNLEFNIRNTDGESMYELNLKPKPLPSPLRK